MFSDGDLGLGVQGTVLDDDWLNAVQEEIAGVIEACGIALVKGTNTQLIAACVAAATANAIVRRDANGRAQVADPAVAADIATKGYVDTVATAAITEATGWAAIGSPTIKRRLGRAYTAGDAGFTVDNVGGAASWALIGNIPEGYRPSGSHRVRGWLYLSAGGTRHYAEFNIAANGNVSGAYYDNGTSLIPSGSWPAIGLNDQAVLTINEGYELP
jgi:hypothetical protein